MKSNPIRDAVDRINIKAKVADSKAAVKEFSANVKSKILTPKRARGGMEKQTPIAKFIEKVKELLNKGKGKGKVRVAFDGDVRGQGDFGGGEGSAPEGLSSFDSWLIRFTIFSVSVFLIYFGVACYTTKELEKKIALADSTIYKVEAEISKANSDAEYIRTKATEYANKITKLEEVMEEIATEKRKSDFDIPNFMSQVMFVIPQGVSITNINIDDMGRVEIYAISPYYAQLGYFVSRLKLEGVMLNVDMSVIEMKQNIKIKIGGMLP